MSNLLDELRVPLTEDEKKEAWKQHINGDGISSRQVSMKVVVLDLGPDSETNQRVYDFLQSHMHPSRIIIASGAQGISKYVPMPRVHDYTLNSGWRIHGEDSVRSYFSKILH